MMPGTSLTLILKYLKETSINNRTYANRQLMHMPVDNVQSHRWIVLQKLLHFFDKSALKLQQTRTTFN